jgi:hypothetical protein
VIWNGSHFDYPKKLDEILGLGRVDLLISGNILIDSDHLERLGNFVINCVLHI